MTALDQFMTDVWRHLLPGDRRALAVIAYCHTLDAQLAQGKFISWSELQTADRVALIRSMRAIGDLAEMCARALERARAIVEADAHA